MSQSHSNLPAPTGGDFILYQTEDGGTRIEVRFSGETVWLSLNQMADLFQRDKSVISKHIKNVFEEGELKPDSVVANCATTAADGKTYQVDFYNLDVIISVGYRVKSHRGTQFRQWATQRLFEERELAPEATVAKFATVQTEGGQEVRSTRRTFFPLENWLRIQLFPFWKILPGTGETESPHNIAAQ